VRFAISEKSVVALNFALIAGCSYFAAHGVNQLVAAHFNLPPAASSALEEPLPASALTRAVYELVVQRDIFNAYKPPPAPVAPVVMDLHLTLTGTSLLSKSKPFAIIEDQATREQNLYRLGETIPNAGPLVKVEKARVLINHDGKLVALEIPSNGMPQAQPMQGLRRGFPGRLLRSDVHPAGKNNYVIDRSAVQRNLQNLGQLFTQMRAVPNLAGGQTDGFRLSEIQSGSLFQQMGLQDGDVVTSINGQPLNDPTQAIALFNTLRNASNISMEVERGGQPVTLTYNIQ